MKEHKSHPQITGTQIWDGLMDAWGVSERIQKIGGLGGFLEQEVVGGSLHRIVIDGEPGTGKSTLLYQSDEKFRAKGIPTQIVAHDGLLARTVKITGVPYTEWGPPHRAIFSDIIFEALSSRPEGTLQLVEAVTVGEQERGQTALHKLSQFKGEHTRTKIIGLIPNLELQDRSARLRSRVLDQENEIRDQDVEAILDREFGVQIEGWSSDTSDRKKGKLIKGAVAKMAPPQIIESIRAEVFRRAGEGVGTARTSPLLEILDSVPQSVREKYQRDYRYWLNLASEIGLDTIVAYNPTHGQRITWYAKMFEK